MKNERSHSPSTILSLLVLVGLLLSLFASNRIAAIQEEEILVLEPSDDSYVSQMNSESNYGDAEVVSVRSFVDNGYFFNHRIYVKFNLESLNERARAGSAILHLYKYIEGGGIGFRRIEVKRVLEPWVENEVTWFNQPSLSVEPTDSVQVSAPGQWYEWDVTEDFRGWAEGSIQNNGFCLTDSNENSPTDYASVFFSREAHEMYIYRPKLEIRPMSGKTSSFPLEYDNVLLVFMGVVVVLVVVAWFVKTRNDTSKSMSSARTRCWFAMCNGVG